MDDLVGMAGLALMMLAPVVLLALLWRLPNRN